MTTKTTVENIIDERCELPIYTLVHFKSENTELVLYSGFIADKPSYKITVTSLEDRNGKMYVNGVKQYVNVLLPAGTIQTLIENEYTTPMKHLEVMTYRFDLVMNVIENTVDDVYGCEWKWDSGTVPVIVNDIEVFYPIFGQCNGFTNRPSVEEIDAQVTVPFDDRIGELYPSISIKNIKIR